MKIQEAKENVMKNFRANYTNDHMAIHDIIVQRYVDYTGNEDIKLNGKEIKWKKSK